MLHIIDIPSIEGFPFIEQSFDSPTLYGLVVKIGKELNKTIIQVNKNTEILDNIDVNFDEINQRIDTLNAEFLQLLNDFDTFKNDVTVHMAQKFAEQYSQLLSLMNDYQASFSLQLANAVDELNNRIDSVILGQINVYNPTTGQVENINKVLTDIYDSVRYDAISCTEFDALELTATDFDAVEITAYNFDNNGKSILTNI